MHVVCAVPSVGWQPLPARKTKFRFSGRGGGENAAPFRKRKMCGLRRRKEGEGRGMSSERGMKMKRLSNLISFTSNNRETPLVLPIKDTPNSSLRRPSKDTLCSPLSLAHFLRQNYDVCRRNARGFIHLTRRRRRNRLNRRRRRVARSPYQSGLAKEGGTPPYGSRATRMLLLNTIRPASLWAPSFRHAAEHWQSGDAIR